MFEACLVWLSWLERVRQRKAFDAEYDGRICGDVVFGEQPEAVRLRKRLRRFAR